MTSGDEILECVLSVDELLTEIEEAIIKKKYDLALHKVKESKDLISDLKADDDASDDRQEIDMHISKML